MSNHSQANDVQKDFGNASLSSTDKTPSPFSLRLSAEERAYLEYKAGSRPLGAYIRETLLGDRCTKRRKQRKAIEDHKQLAVVLSALGQSRMSSNLNQIAKAANDGTLDMPEDTQQQLDEAYQAILAMREALFIALGMRT